MRPFVSTVLLAVLAGGCAQAPYTRSAADEIEWANFRIDQQRLIKRSLLEADPIERAIENHLNSDPRVSSARFAILLSDSFGHRGPGFHFTTVITAQALMADADVADLLHSASRAAGMTANLAYSTVIRDGDTLTVSAWLNRIEEENPDLSPLRTDLTGDNPVAAEVYQRWRNQQCYYALVEIVDAHLTERSSVYRISRQDVLTHLGEPNWGTIGQNETDLAYQGSGRHVPQGNKVIFQFDAGDELVRVDWMSE